MKSRSMIFNGGAWVLFGSVILFDIVYGHFFPFQYYQPARPMEFLITLIPLVSLILFAGFAFLGTAFVSIKSRKFRIIVRVLLTVLHCLFACGLFILLIMFTCSFGAGECCC